MVTKKKLEAVLEIMKEYISNRGAGGRDSKAVEMLIVVCNKHLFEEVFYFFPNVLHTIFTDCLEILDAYISDPDNEPEDIQELYRIIESEVSYGSDCRIGWK